MDGCVSPHQVNQHQQVFEFSKEELRRARGISVPIESPCSLVPNRKCRTRLETKLTCCHCLRVVFLLSLSATGFCFCVNRDASHSSMYFRVCFLHGFQRAALEGRCLGGDVHTRLVLCSCHRGFRQPPTRSPSSSPSLGECSVYYFIATFQGEYCFLKHGKWDRKGLGSGAKHSACSCATPCIPRSSSFHSAGTMLFSHQQRYSILLAKSLY